METKSASLGIRALAAILDSAIVLLAQYYIVEKWGDIDPNGDAVLRGFPVFLLLLATAAFWILPEWLLGVTLGKWAFNLRVTTMSGGNISFTQALKRNLLRLIDFFPFYVTGFVAASLTPKRQRLGDLWAKTIVVSSKSRQAVAEITPS
jgi:uncharacterized RDD family membrane protein YckC